MSQWYARPVFFVADCDKALNFYQSLGFQEGWRNAENDLLVAVQVELNGVELILNRNPERAGGGRLFFSLDRGEVSSIVQSFNAAGVEVRDDYWGMPVKVVRDLDGNDLLFFDDELRGKP